MEIELVADTIDGYGVDMDHTATNSGATIKLRKDDTVSKYGQCDPSAIGTWVGQLEALLQLPANGKDDAGRKSEENESDG